jgi:hypothetical protein
MIIYYVLCFPFFHKKDFNFLEINQNGLSQINPLPPKYKYFVVQQFFRCPPRRGGIQKTPYHKNVPFLWYAIF